MAIKGNIPWNKGLKLGPNPEHSKRMMGSIPWNKGKKGSQVGHNKGKHLLPETRRKISVAHKGKKLTEEHKRNISLNHARWNKGKKASEELRKKLSKVHLGHRPSDETREKMSAAHKARKEQNHLWKGGITKENRAIRTCFEYRFWREKVFERDNYTCQICGERGKVLNADHIKPFAYYPELRFAIDNGRTLCESCHKKTITYSMQKLPTTIEINDMIEKVKVELAELEAFKLDLKAAV